MTNMERVLLMNQYRILAVLYPDNASQYAELVEIVQNGYEAFYSMLDDWLGDPMPAEEGRFVLDILNVYRAIEDHKRSNPEGAVAGHSFAYFPGFSGNEEGEYLAFARFLVDVQGKFAEQQAYFDVNDHMNSHFPMLRRYKSMLAAWKSLGEPFQLTEEQALSLLTAGCQSAPETPERP